MVTTTIIVAGGDVEGEVSGGEIEEASGVAEAAGEAGEIGVSEETEEAEEAEEIWVSEEADEERAAEEAEGHGVVKETLTKRQTHIARRVGAKRAITLQIKPDGDKAQRRISRQTQMHRRPGEGQAPMPGWGVNNSVPQTVWTSTEIERNKRPPDQSAGNAAKKLKSYVLHELEQVRRRVEEWEAGWDEEREGEGVVERAVEGGGLVEKMVWQSEATFLVVWPAWMWGAAAAAGFGDIGGRSRIDERRFSWAKQMPGQRMVGAEGVVEPE
ncbi:hypothetical protein GMDG_07441 [Pseudogymnoascus destructans 20631-21]|uniref:Uncharacterized protein n=1 Tax=Pseudogymnoascus destructans (strain ATCC MYA-4855 / 20631-21) TaxID=658429 RepID=L8FY97_PSED2|nr:hypothetical protein GMDG_07441 [Pseudogymnoascus destructans 20631-21]